MIKLSIIIPAFNAEPYIHELLDAIEPQITNEIQVIVVDDGSSPALEIDKEWVEFYCNDVNKGAAYTRNRGLELAKGKYIHFVDADDLLADNYVEYVMARIDKDSFDYMDLSWKSVNGSGPQFDFKLRSDKDSLPVPSASTRIFSRKFIGDHRFNENKDAAEDADFTRHLNLKRGKRICATQYMYFYRTSVPESNSKLFIAGETKTRRIAYYFRNFTQNMRDEIEQIKKDDQQHEVILLTNHCEVPEIERYCKLVCPPNQVIAMVARGEPTNLISIIPIPVKADVVIYTHQTFLIGGIETFIYSFCQNLYSKYDIVVLYDFMDPAQIKRVSKYARCIKNDKSTPIVCDTVIINRIFDDIPQNVKYKKSIQMAHCIKQGNWYLPQTRDAIVCVSNASKQSFGELAKSAKVINNMSYEFPEDRLLFLVSATRIGADDKGKNDRRMIKLANLMNKRGIKYIWLYFGNQRLTNAPSEMIYMGQMLDVAPYIRKADYLVQLSDKEAFSYSLLEALCLGTPLIVTPLSQNKDMRIKDGVNAHIVPFDFDDTYDVSKFLSIPKFSYKYDNKRLINKWVDVIENTKPKSKEYKQPVLVEVKITYNDLRMNKLLSSGEIVQMERERAEELISKGFVEMKYEQGREH